MLPGTEIAPGVHRLGTEVVNYYVLEDGGKLTVVDAGCPRHIDQLQRFLGDRGWSLGVVDTVVLTHAHADHIGFAEQARADGGAKIRVHHADAVIATGGNDGRTTETGIARYLWRPAAYRTILDVGRAGGARLVPVAEVSAFADGEVLDVPGRPTVLHTPGHTRGSAALHVRDRGVVFSGDALVTWNPLTGRDGPQIMPAAFNEDSAEALRSLDRLHDVEADVLLPGHGPPWSGGAAEAVSLARSAGRS